MEKTVIGVSGMSCKHCQKAVNDALNALDGVKSADADLKKANVTVKFDAAKISIGALKAAINDAGYTAA